MCRCGWEKPAAAAEKHIGVNIWCHKGVESADAATLCTYQVPEGFEKLCAYAQTGAGKPSYEESIRLFDEYLEKVRFENCTLHEDRVDAVLRRAGVSVPAVGYDMFPGAGASFEGSYPYCVFCDYRREDRMHIVYEKGYTPLEIPAFSFATRS